MYEIWKLYIENYSGYCVRTKLLIKFLCDLDLWAPKCICIFRSPSCIYVWNMTAARWELLELSCQKQRVDKVHLWPWPLDSKMYRYFCLAILHLWMKYDSCTLKTTQVIVSEPKCWQSSFVTLTFWPPKCIGIFLSPSCIFVWNKNVHCTLKTTQVILSELQCWRKDRRTNLIPIGVLIVETKYILLFNGNTDICHLSNETQRSVCYFVDTRRICRRSIHSASTWVRPFVRGLSVCASVFLPIRKISNFVHFKECDYKCECCIETSHTHVMPTYTCNLIEIKKTL